MVPRFDTVHRCSTYSTTARPHARAHTPLYSRENKLANPVYDPVSNRITSTSPGDRPFCLPLVSAQNPQAAAAAAAVMDPISLTNARPFSATAEFNWNRTRGRDDNNNPFSSGRAHTGLYRYNICDRTRMQTAYVYGAPLRLHVQRSRRGFSASSQRVLNKNRERGRETERERLWSARELNAHPRNDDERLYDRRVSAHLTLHALSDHKSREHS